MGQMRNGEATREQQEQEAIDSLRATGIKGTRAVIRVRKT